MRLPERFCWWRRKARIPYPQGSALQKPVDRLIPLKIESADFLEKVFGELHIPVSKTKTWTTDAFYRETRRNLELRKKEGCGVVEMECASLMAVGQFRKVPVYQFLYSADCIGGNEWDERILGKMPDTLREKILLIALEAATRL